MKTMHVIITLFLAALLAACAEDGKYPMSGEACSPDDPVVHMTPDCPALTGTGTF